nr:MAG TPA: hypothetical protein [Caudoviricetes sp.]
MLPPVWRFILDSVIIIHHSVGLVNTFYHDF